MMERCTFNFLCNNLVSLLKLISLTYANWLKLLICDRIVIGIRDPDTIEHFLVEKGLTLMKAIDICRAEETAKKSCKVLTVNSSVNAVFRYKQKQHTDHSDPDKCNPTTTPWPRCTENYDNDHPCPDRDTTRTACGKKSIGQSLDTVNRKKNNKQHSAKPPTGKLPAMGGIIASVNHQKVPKVWALAGAESLMALLLTPPQTREAIAQFVVQAHNPSLALIQPICACHLQNYVLRTLMKFTSWVKFQLP